jgi:hypothetical protein
MASKALKSAKSPTPFTVLYYRTASDLEKKLFAAAKEMLAENVERIATHTTTALKDTQNISNQRRDSAYDEEKLNASNYHAASLKDAPNSPDQNGAHDEHSSTAGNDYITSSTITRSGPASGTESVEMTPQGSTGVFKQTTQGSLTAIISSVGAVCKAWHWQISLPVNIDVKMTALEPGYDTYDLLQKVHQTLEEMTAITDRSDLASNGLIDSTAVHVARRDESSPRRMPGNLGSGSCGEQAAKPLASESDSEVMSTAQDVADWLREGIF